MHMHAYIYVLLLLALIYTHVFIISYYSVKYVDTHCLV